LKLKIALIISFIFGFIACSGGGDSLPDSNSSTNKAEKTKIKKVKKIKKIEEKNIEDESLDSDFDEEKDEESLEEDFNEDEEEKTEKIDVKAEFNGRIKRIDFEPKVIKADSDIKVFTQIVPGPLDSESVLYTFIINGEIITSGSKDRVLKRGKFKKGDLISVKVSIAKGDEIIEEQKTEMFKVANSNPKITKLPSLNVTGFKTYSYEVEAEDIDNDSITFELEGDIPPGMSIDQFTGKITYIFSSKPEKNAYIFKIIASDTDGGKDIKEITMGFKEEK